MITYRIRNIRQRFDTALLDVEFYDSETGDTIAVKSYTRVLPEQLEQANLDAFLASQVDRLQSLFERIRAIRQSI
jgi:hypothetical protein